MEERGVVGITENVKTVPRDIVAPREPPLYESQHEERLADFSSLPCTRLHNEYDPDVNI